MSLPSLSVGFTPLVDAAPVIVAREMGFARAEGLAISLHRAPSWSASRDMLAFGAVDAAHMLSAVPVATALGLGGAGAPIHALSVLSVNGNVIGVSRALAARMRGQGYGFGFDDARAAGTALLDATGPGLRIGVPFPFSMHAELIRYWLAALTGAPAGGVEIRTVPPPLMAEAIGAGEIDAFCVGEPWGSITVETGTGELLLPGCAIWDAAPEKVLAVRADEAELERFAPLVRALWRAGRWLAQPGSRTAAAEMLARREYLDMSAEVIDRALSGRMTVSARGEARRVERMVEFDPDRVGFPFGIQAAWIGRRLAQRAGRDPASAELAAREVFRGDLYRRMLAGIGAAMPAADSQATAPGLRRDRFFDSRVFDPSRVD